MGAQVLSLRAVYPHPLLAVVRRWSRFRALLSRRAGARRSRLLAEARECFDERRWHHEREDPREDARVHRWKPM